MQDTSNRTNRTATADLSSCEREPLAFSGQIQDVGALVATAPGTQEITHISGNLDRWFDVPADPRELELNGLFADDVNYFHYRQRMLFENRHYLISNVITNRGIEGDLSYSRHPSCEIYEFEPKGQSAEIPEAQAREQPVTVSEAVFTSDLRVEELMRRIHGMTGYPKIMLYRFLEDGSGDVVAELSDGKLDNYQGLRFPSSDIPQIARSLYINNPYRLIFDTRGGGSPVRSIGDESASIDLSNSILRSVSPVHVEYLGNMGVRSSASFPVLVMGRLWGLMALHAVEPTPIPMTQRVAVRQLVEQELSRRIMDGRITAEHQRFNASVAQLAEGATLLQQVLTGTAPDGEPAVLKTLVESDGLVLRLNERIIYNDAGISDEDCATIADLGRQQSMNNQFSTDCLQRFMEQDTALRSRASGALYITSGADEDRGHLEVIWLRTEQAGTVTWAGNPEKVEEEIEGEVRISPRKSFEAWSTETQGHSRPWASPDVMVASKLMVQTLTGRNS